MKVVSIDVGIANLAICVLSLESKKENEEHKPADIHLWKVLDLMELEPPVKPPSCSAIIKRTKKQCVKRAQFHFEEKHFCKTHEPHKGDQIEGKKLIQKKKPRKVKTLLKHELCDRMIKKLDTLQEECDLLDTDYILIELQPGKNQKMKAFSEMIFTYFSIRAHDQEKSKRRIKQVKFINAKNKLTLYDGPAIACKLKDKYARRKFFGIEHCKYFLQTPCRLTTQNEGDPGAERPNQGGSEGDLPPREEDKNKYLNLLLKSSKKDDLADSYLQGLYFLRTKC